MRYTAKNGITLTLWKASSENQAVNIEFPGQWGAVWLSCVELGKTDWGREILILAEEAGGLEALNQMIAEHTTLEMEDDPELPSNEIEDV